MAEKIVIEVFRKKEPEELMGILSDPEGKLDMGSGAALVGAEACAMGLRAARLSAGKLGEQERLDYILRNLEKLRDYMIYLIDEDVKGRNIRRRAIKEGDAQKIDASVHPACAICDEIINQMCNALELIDELSALDLSGAIYLGSAAELCRAAMRSARLYVVEMTRGNSDQTYAFITRRENEITWEKFQPVIDRILSRVEETLK